MKTFIFSIRFLVPTAIILFVVLTLGFSYYLNQSFISNQVIEQSKDKLQNQLNYLQSSAEILLTSNSSGQLQKIISGFSAQHDLTDLYITDQKGIIVASSKYVNLHQHWIETTSATNLSDIEESIKYRKSILSYKNDLMTGISPVCPDPGDVLRNKTCGFIFYQLDLKFQHNQLASNIFTVLNTAGTGIISGAIILILSFTFFLTRRTNIILNALSRFSSGERNIEIAMSGYDELSQIGRSVDLLFFDISKHEELLNQKESQMRGLVESMADAVISIDQSGNIQSFNSTAETMLGYTKEEVIGKNVKLLMQEPYQSQHDTYLQTYLDTGNKKIIGKGRQVVARKKSGEIFPVDLAVSEINTQNGKVFTGILHDISQQKQLEAQLVEKTVALEKVNRELSSYAITDPLTGIYNRRYLDSTLLNEINRAKRNKSYISLIFCDVDYFKLLNDSEGHQKGDQILITIAHVLNETFTRSGDTVTRYGGEEFAIILSNTDPAQALNVANILHNNINTKKIPHPASSIAPHLTLSIGIASIQPTNKTDTNELAELIVKEADEALYKAKANGRNQVVQY